MSLRRRILVDGYNAIRADPGLARLETRSMEAARDALVAMIAATPRLGADEVTVVYDGSQEPTGGLTSAVRHRHVAIRFSPAGKSADDVIKMLAAADPTATVVITNDGEIRRYCQALGCAVTSPENMLSQISRPPSIKQPRREGLHPDVQIVNGSSKKGNPRRLPKRSRRAPPDYQF
ncbi:MAG TPA: NYN domain-containing protein [Chloroflexota bacterium]|nr:NYN domain-containing protein [Chloroflexota bacterium]